MTERQRGILSLCESMGYPDASPEQAQSIDALAADEIREHYGDLLDEVGDNPALTVETLRRIEDAINPITRAAVRTVMVGVTLGAMAGAGA